MKALKWLGSTVAVIVGGVGVALIAWNILDRGPAIAPATADANGFDVSHLLVLVDGYMSATAYADGQLYPIEGAADLIVSLDGIGTDVVERTDTVASNTVMGWPGAMTADSAGRFAYVVESRKGAPQGVAAMESVFDGLPQGTLMTTVDLESGAVVGITEVCTRPNSIDLSADETWLLIACGDAAAELTVVPLENGQPSSPRSFDLDLPDITERPDIDGGVSYAMIHPDGSAAGYILANLGVGLVTFTLDADGIPSGATAEAPTLEGEWNSVGRWTNSGNHFLVADVAWGPAPTDAVINGDGQILSFALSPDDDVRGVVSAATVSKSPEAFEINRAGDRLVVVNMERTYLPSGMLSLVPGRSAASLSLVSVDDETGMLETLGEPVGFVGVLPEDAVFDADGDRVAVVIYQDHDAPRSDGWVEVFAIDNDQIQATGERIPLPRGAHDLFALD